MKTYLKQHKKFYTLLVFTLLGFLLRFVGQPNIPAGFHRDEAGIAYSAYSILHTGRDDWGQLLPLHTKALGDYPPAMYNYLVALSIPIFGLSEFAERWPAILFGTVLIPVSFLWVREMFRDERLALLVAGVVTISPWDIVQSRSGSESIVALVFTLAAWLLWSSWLQKAKKWHVLVIALFYFCALFSYNAVKLALPLLHILLTWYWWKQLPKKSVVVIFSLLFLLTAWGSVFFISGAGDNFAGNSIFANSQPVGQEYFFREGNMQVPVVLSRVFHNRYASLATQTLGNFGTFLSSNFLFFHAGQPGRYEVPGAGQLLPFFAPFLLLGVFASTRFTQRQRLFLLGWIVIALLPAVITTTAFPHVKRSMYLYLPLYIFIAEGLLLTITWARQRRLGWALLSLLTAAGLWSFGYFVNQYLVHTQYETILARDYGYRQAYEFIDTVADNYAAVNVYGFDESPEIFYFFYQKIDPKLVQAVADSRPSNIFAIQQDRRNFSFGKYSFNTASCPESEELEEYTLYFSDAICIKDNNLSEDRLIQVLYSLNYQNGSERFVIFEKKTEQALIQ